ncbi:MAG: cupin domain-containing protein [Gemmatimonadota bacterium]
MRWIPFVAATTLAIVACDPSAVNPRIEDDDFVDTSGWETYTVDGLKAEGTSVDGHYVEALSDPFFRMGVLSAPPGVAIGLVTHLDNALYYVQRGEGTLAFEQDTVALAEGEVLFVRGGTEHRIYDVSTGLDLVVILPRGLSIPEDPEWVHLGTDSLTAGRRPDQNTWAVLFETSTAGVGVYHLPKGGQDEGLTHAFPEIKLVMSGGGRFDLANGGVEASSGTVAYIPGGIRHQIRRVSDDISVLFMWKK